MAGPIRLLETSVIVRYLTNDIPALAGRARLLVESETSLGITAVALLEAAHVLSRPPYAHTREAVVDALVALLQRENVRGVGVEDQHAAAALLLCRSSGTVSFGDALIAATGLSAGVAEVYSFDARIGRAGLRPVPLPDPAAADGPGPP